MQKKICPKNEGLYIFEKPLTMPFQICKNFCKIFNNLIFNQEKLKMCKFISTGCLQKNLQFFFAKLVQFVSLCQRLSKNVIKIWQIEMGQNKDLVWYRKKQWFRQYAWGLRPLVLKGGLWVCRKNQKISTVSDQYFLSYVKKTTGGRVNLTPPVVLFT